MQFGTGSCLLVLLTAPTVAGAQAECAYALSDSVAVHEVATSIVEADNRRDLEAVLGHYADDAVLYPPGETQVRGRDAIRPRYELLFASYDPKIVSEVDGIRLCGTLAVVTGRNRGWLRGRGERADRALSDAFVMVVEKGDGPWAITRLMWHADKPQ